MKPGKNILEDLDDPRAATLLTSIDYLKAFNRLNFDHCLNFLREKGASAEILAIVKSFLTDRYMLVKLGNARSVPRPVLGGVPQGSKLGVILFNNSIDNFESNSPDIPAYPLLGGAATNYVQPARTFREETDNAVPPVVPRQDTNLRLWKLRPLGVRKYVDDNILYEKLFMEASPTNPAGLRCIAPTRLQNLFRRIIARAIASEMAVNSKKTKSILISDAKTYVAEAAFLDSGGNTIRSGNVIKILGFQT